MVSLLPACLTTSWFTSTLCWCWLCVEEGISLGGRYSWLCLWPLSPGLLPKFCFRIYTKDALLTHYTSNKQFKAWACSCAHLGFLILNEAWSDTCGCSVEGWGTEAFTRVDVCRKSNTSFLHRWPNVQDERSVETEDKNTHMSRKMLPAAQYLQHFSFRAKELDYPVPRLCPQERPFLDLPFKRAVEADPAWSEGHDPPYAPGTSPRLRPSQIGRPAFQSESPPHHEREKGETCDALMVIGSQIQKHEGGGVDKVFRRLLNCWLYSKSGSQVITEPQYNYVHMRSYLFLAFCLSLPRKHSSPMP